MQPEYVLFLNSTDPAASQYYVWSRSYHFGPNSYTKYMNHEQEKHTIYGPAVAMYLNRKLIRTECYINGKKHNYCGPAVYEYTTAGKTREVWYRNDVMYNDYGPAINRFLSKL